MIIDENYKLENDSNQWVLIYEKEGEINPKTDKPIISKDRWYCSNLESALNRYANEASKVADNIERLQIELVRIHGAINSLSLKTHLK